MRERSLGEARRALETIAARDPRGALGEAALLDLARLALADGDRAEARRALARLPARCATPPSPRPPRTCAAARSQAAVTTARLDHVRCSRPEGSQPPCAAAISLERLPRPSGPDVPCRIAVPSGVTPWSAASTFATPAELDVPVPSAPVTVSGAESA